ncbi:MAG: hypothetical protein IJ297_04740 [Clostridia bacterium]|nr:hypothetical protein [Clostridia bacterium]
MIKNEIELKSLNSFGIAKAYVDEKSVTVKVFGVSGCLKAWLTGEKTVEIGNLVNGTLQKNIDTAGFDGILLTQSGRQMFYGKFRPSGKSQPDAVQTSENEKTDAIFNFNDGYTWQKITSKKFPSDSLSVRYILSHKCFYNSFLLHGRYYYGTNGDKVAIAIECDIKNEPHPFLPLSAYSVFRDGYMIVVTDAKNFLTYEY